MSYRLYSDEEKRLQRKLIPLNLIVALLALVAAVSLIITPLLKIDIGKIAPALMDAVSPGSEDGDSGEGEGGDSSQGGAASQYSVIFENVDAEIVLAPLDMLKVLTAPANEKGSILISKMFIENGLFEQLSLSLVNVSLAVASEAVKNVEELQKLDLNALNDALYKIDDAKSSEEVVAQLNDYMALLEQQLEFKFTDEQKQAAEENTVKLYNDTVEATGGSFSVEQMICVNMSPEGGEVYTSYSDLMAGLLNGDLGSSEESSGFAEYAEMINQLAAPYGYMFIFVAFHVLMWFILFLFAFFRTFAKNKRFTMWYVKLVSCWPCIIFFLLPFAMSKAAVGIEMLAPFAGIFAAITSMTWISGICYLLLWALSICWAFPIKHKIRKLRKGR